MSELYTVEKDTRGVYFIKLNRPELHNAFNAKMIQDLTKLFISFENDQNIRLVVLSGNGKSFCAGADLNWMKGMIAYDEKENFKDSQKLFKMFDTINSCKVPVISKITGAALGGGIGLIAASDFCIASDNAKFGLTEVKLGLIPAVISPFVINKIGESYARAYFLSGAIFETQKALQMGLIHDVCSIDEMEDKIDSLIKSFLKAAPRATKFCKDLIFENTQAEKTGSPSIKNEYICSVIAKLRVSDEGQEGMNALLDKRKPNWME